MTTIKELAKEALDVQNACNLGGVVYSFAKAMEALWALPECKGTEWRNLHPVSVLFADKIADLTGTQSFSEEVAAAYKWARAVVNGEVVS